MKRKIIRYLLLITSPLSWYFLFMIFFGLTVLLLGVLFGVDVQQDESLRWVLFGMPVMAYFVLLFPFYFVFLLYITRNKNKKQSKTLE